MTIEECATAVSRQFLRHGKMKGTFYSGLCSAPALRGQRVNDLVRWVIKEYWRDVEAEYLRTRSASPEPVQAPNEVKA